jgi:choline kinase
MSAAAALAVILGAGRPARGQLPAALFAIAGHGRVLDWQVNALAQSASEVVFIGGYRLPEIVALYPSLRVAVNPNWTSTGAVGSLLRANLAPDRPCLVAYADILFRDELVRALCHPAADVAIAVDSHWRSRYDNRSAADIDAAEVVCLDGERLVSAHGRRAAARPSAPQAEYVGLARFGPRAQAFLQQRSAQPEVAGWDIPQLLNALVEAGLEVVAVDCEGDWAELNAMQDVACFVLGTKAQTLARLRPMVSRSRIGEQVVFTVGDWCAGRSACLQRIRAAFGDDELVVRSSALDEDGFANSAAGRFESVLGVDGRDAQALAIAIDRVVSSYGDAVAGHQVLVQRMVRHIRLAGVAMTRTLSHGAPYRVINYDDSSGASDGVTSGQGGALKALYVHRDSLRLPPQAPSGLHVLLDALREIEALVGHDSLDIEFIVSTDDIVHVLQIRPIAVDHADWRGSDELVREAASSARADFIRLQVPGPFVLGRRAPFSLMTDWNPAEMIGSRPRRLAFSLYDELITREVWAHQREDYGYRRVAPQPLMYGFAGHAYIDVRASLNSFVPAEVDDALAARLVDHGIERLLAQTELHDKVEFEVAFTCLSFDFNRRSRHLLDAGFTAAEVGTLREALRQLTRRGIGRVDGDVAAIAAMSSSHAAIAAAAHDPLRRALLLLDACRTHGTPNFAHLARAGFVATALLNSAVSEGVIGADERDAFLQAIPTVATDFRDDLACLHGGRMDRAAFLAVYGHLRPGTYDITVPSYAEAPEVYLGPSSGLPPAETAADAAWSNATKKRFADALASLGLDLPFDVAAHFIRQAIAGRERAKFVFTRSLSVALDLVARFGADSGLDREELSHLSVADLRAVDSGLLCNDRAAVLRARIEEGRLAHELALGIELPPLLTDEAEIDAFFYPEMAPNYVGKTAVTAPVVCIDERVEPAGVAGCIVLARQADPGHDWLFAHGIAGLVTAYGGANSHMAVRAAEFGLPAAIGVGEWRYHQLAGAKRLRLDARQRTLTLLH